MRDGRLRALLSARFSRLYGPGRRRFNNFKNFPIPIAHTALYRPSVYQNDGNGRRSPLREIPECSNNKPHSGDVLAIFKTWATSPLPWLPNDKSFFDSTNFPTSSQVCAWAWAYAQVGRAGYRCGNIQIEGRGIWLAKSAAQCVLEDHLQRAAAPSRPNSKLIVSESEPSMLHCSSPGKRVNLTAFIDEIFTPANDLLPLVCAKPPAADNQNVVELPLLPDSYILPEDPTPGYLTFPTRFAYKFNSFDDASAFVSYFQDEIGKVIGAEDGAIFVAKFKSAFSDGIDKHIIYLQPAQTISTAEKEMVNAILNKYRRSISPANAKHFFPRYSWKWAEEHLDYRMLHNYLTRLPGTGSVGVADPCTFLRVLDASMLVGWTDAPSVHNNPKYDQVAPAQWSAEQLGALARFHKAYLKRASFDLNVERNALSKVPPIGSNTNWPRVASPGFSVATCDGSKHMHLPEPGTSVRGGIVEALRPLYLLLLPFSCSPAIVSNQTPPSSLARYSPSRPTERFYRKVWRRADAISKYSFGRIRRIAAKHVRRPCRM